MNIRTIPILIYSYEEKILKETDEKEKDSLREKISFLKEIFRECSEKNIPPLFLIRKVIKNYQGIESCYLASWIKNKVDLFKTINDRFLSKSEIASILEEDNLSCVIGNYSTNAFLLASSALKGKSKLYNNHDLVSVLFNLKV